ncbi:hypothetical protein SAY86_008617 [Trapa natans]|uniref:Late embryogenesis abundant protein LEA-2 subgroup domain-containing protein n=1 Tax=Trapa natans TaxID=22666 RepID=A0AAN7K9P7_TRANT|nr:hypothetical protein SAY86_008617 [Trapa natans]
MADRVHPHESPERPPFPAQKASDQPPSEAKQEIPSPARTYVVKVPKDQIIRVPPPQNAKLFERYTRRSSRRGRRCCCLTLVTLTVLLLLAGAASGIFYLIVRPKSPSYTVTALSITGLNVTSSASSLPISSEIVVAVRAKNPNGKVGIYHVGGSSVRAYYADVGLGDGVLPVLYLPSKSETAFNATVRGNGIVLGSEMRQALADKQSQGSVPLRLKLKAPVKFKVGAIKSWKITVKLTCDVTVDKLTVEARIVTEHCHYGVKIF